MCASLCRWFVTPTNRAVIHPVSAKSPIAEQSFQHYELHDNRLPVAYGVRFPPIWPSAAAVSYCAGEEYATALSLLNKRISQSHSRPPSGCEAAPLEII